MFQGLTISDLEDLLEDIKVYLELEQGKNTEYWRDIVTVTEDELLKLKKLENSGGRTSVSWRMPLFRKLDACFLLLLGLVLDFQVESLS